MPRSFDDTPPTYFPFFWSDWLNDEIVMGMSLAAQGAYLRLLCHAWRQTPPGTIPSHPDTIMRLCGATGDEWEQIKDEILEPWELDGDRYKQKRLVQVWHEVRNESKSKSKLASKAASARWKNRDNDTKNKGSDASAYAGACGRNASAYADDAKRREEKRSKEKNTPLTPQGGQLGDWGSITDLLPESHRTEPMRESWESWMRHRRKRTKLTPEAVRKQVKQISGIPPDRAIAMLEHSTAGGYAGLFEPNSKSGGGNNANTGQAIHGRRIKPT